MARVESVKNDRVPWLGAARAFGTMPWWVERCKEVTT